MDYSYTSNFLKSHLFTWALAIMADGFGEKGKPASNDKGVVPPNATLNVTLELVSWKTVAALTDDKKVIKKILKEGEGYDRPNDGAIVKGEEITGLVCDSLQ